MVNTKIKYKNLDNYLISNAIYYTIHDGVYRIHLGKDDSTIEYKIHARMIKHFGYREGRVEYHKHSCYQEFVSLTDEKRITRLDSITYKPITDENDKHKY